MKKLVFLFCILNLMAASLSGQTQESKLQLMIDEGVVLMNNQDYVKANEKFTQVIDQLKPLPSRMAYYFGKNSYFMAEYKQSINWLSKYIQLKGTAGPFYEESKRYLELAEQKYLQRNKKELAELEEDLSNEFECYSKDKMTCPACKGSGVRITKGIMGNHYETCPYSGADGYLTCEEYNLFLQGKLKPSPAKNN